MGAVSHLIHAGREGEDWVPLSDVWWLYESWVIERVATCLERLLGVSKPPARSDPASLIGSWNPIPGETIELHYQLTFPTVGAVDLMGSKWRSVTSQLTPDAVLAVRRGNEVQVVLIDPKEWALLSAGDATSEASKYLWGIRRLGRLDEPGAVERVVLVSPLSGPDAADLLNGRAQVMHAAPFARPSQPVGQVGQDLSTPQVQALLALVRGGGSLSE